MAQLAKDLEDPSYTPISSWTSAIVDFLIILDPQRSKRQCHIILADVFAEVLRLRVVTFEEVTQGRRWLI